MARLFEKTTLHVVDTPLSETKVLDMLLNRDFNEVMQAIAHISEQPSIEPYVPMLLEALEKEKNSFRKGAYNRILQLLQKQQLSPETLRAIQEITNDSPPTMRKMSLPKSNQRVLDQSDHPIKRR